MSLDRIAEALGAYDYGDHHDEVDWRDRLTEARYLLNTGLLIDVDELIEADAQPFWHDACSVFLPLGWKPLVTWPGQLEIKLVPPHVTSDRTDKCLAPNITTHYDGLWYWCPLWDSGDGNDMRFTTATELLAWLATP